MSGDGEVGKAMRRPQRGHGLLFISIEVGWVPRRKSHLNPPHFPCGVTTRCCWVPVLVFSLPTLIPVMSDLAPVPLIVQWIRRDGGIWVDRWMIKGGADGEKPEKKRPEKKEENCEQWHGSEERGEAYPGTAETGCG